jgi:uncharacterized protein
MSTDHIRYDLLVQDALRSVVKTVLADAAKHGLPGEHHFFVSFKTHAAGVRISNRLREQYPDEMTIVLQHQYRDLNVTDTTFEVGLSFGGIPERLLIPYEAIVGFFDPSVQFGLKFEVQEPERSAGNDDGQGAPAVKSVATLVPVKAPEQIHQGKENPVHKPAAAEKPKSNENRASPSKPASKSKKKPAEEPPPPVVEPPAGGSVVSLDAFRKKK